MLSESVRVRYKTISIKIYPFIPKEGYKYWRFHNGERTITRSTFEKAKEEALRCAEETYLGRLRLGRLTDAQIRNIRRMMEVDPLLSFADEFVLWCKKRHPKKQLGEARKEFLAAKESAAGDSAYNVTRLRHRLASLPDVDLGMITPADLPKLSGEARTQRNHIGAWVTFFRWCKKQGYLPEGELTAPEKLERPKVMRSVPETWTRAELDVLMANVTDQYKPWLALAAWAGLRVEEICPDKASKKDGLRWEDVRFDQGVIIVRPEVSKINQRRVIELQPCLAAALRPIAGKGRIVPGIPPHRQPARKVEAETVRLGKLVGGWKVNALRHSFISYRAAQVGISKAAMEAGNSESVARRNYNDSMSEADGAEWFR